MCSKREIDLDHEVIFLARSGALDTLVKHVSEAHFTHQPVEPLDLALGTWPVDSLKRHDALSVGRGIVLTLDTVGLEQADVVSVRGLKSLCVSVRPNLPIQFLEALPLDLSVRIVEAESLLAGPAARLPSAPR
jgi:hypothetical protein